MFKLFSSVYWHNTNNNPTKRRRKKNVSSTMTVRQARPTINHHCVVFKDPGTKDIVLMTIMASLLIYQQHLHHIVWFIGDGKYIIFAYGIKYQDVWQEGTMNMIGLSIIDINWIRCVYQSLQTKCGYSGYMDIEELKAAWIMRHNYGFPGRTSLGH